MGGVTGGGAATTTTTAPASLPRAVITRLLSDVREMQASPPEGCSAAPLSESNLLLWNASIIGPEDSPWEGGIFSLRLQFPESYPNKPPRVRFTSVMFHPNVYSDGTLCLDLLQDNWKPIYTVASILTAIQSLLTDPNPNSPANPEAARLYVENPKEYKRRVRRNAQQSTET